jgi:hypothetical protein
MWGACHPKPDQNNNEDINVTTPEMFEIDQTVRVCIHLLKNRYKSRYLQILAIYMNSPKLF